MLSSSSNVTDIMEQGSTQNAEKTIDDAQPTTSAGRAATSNKNAIEQLLHTANSIAPQNSISSFYDSALLTPPDLLSEEDEEMFYNLNEPRYCICNQISYGAMIACDNKTCPYEWFHFPCVGVIRPPKGKWFCPLCKASMRSSGKRKRKLS